METNNLVVQLKIKLIDNKGTRKYSNIKIQNEDATNNVQLQIGESTNLFVDGQLLYKALKVLTNNKEE
jgi:hypothetical protein|tara:strand:+ start:237 stop:440 length:204 start_codon:yes stop_codon:yes gene_type:complete